MYQCCVLAADDLDLQIIAQGRMASTSGVQQRIQQTPHMVCTIHSPVCYLHYTRCTRCTHLPTICTSDVVHDTLVFQSCILWSNAWIYNDTNDSSAICSALASCYGKDAASWLIDASSIGHDDIKQEMVTNITKADFRAMMKTMDIQGKHIYVYPVYTVHCGAI